MPFLRPTLAQLVDDARAELSKIPGVDAQLRRTILEVLVRAHSAQVWSLYGFIQFLSQQIFADTAEREFLERIAAIFGIQRIGGLFATGQVQLTGADGAVVPSASRLRRTDGVEYETIAEVVIAGGVATPSVTAVLAGESGNAAGASLLTFTSPIASVDATATFDGAGATGGDDGETDARLRDRLLDRIRRPPDGGAIRDYEKWTREALPGVTRVWVTSPASGLVHVIFAMDDDLVSILPDAAEIQAVLDYIADPERKPVTAEIQVAAPTLLPIAFDISGLVPDTPAVRAAIEAELADLFRREGAPSGTVLLSHIRESISLAEGETDHALVTPVADVVTGLGEIPTLGLVTYS